MQSSRSAAEGSVQPAKAGVIKLVDPKEALEALPIRVAQSSATIQGRLTQVVTQHYADRILVIVTQVGKIGALTQVTLHKRPAFSFLQDDDFDEEVQEQLSTRDQQQQQGQGKTLEDSNMVATFQTLFGSVPIGQETLYDFYKSQISSLIHNEMERGGSGGAAAMESGLQGKPIIIGLSLSLPRQQNNDAEERQEEEEGDFAALADTERERFQAVLGLISQARTW